MQGNFCMRSVHTVSKNNRLNANEGVRLLTLGTAAQGKIVYCLLCNALVKI